MNTREVISSCNARRWRFVGVGVAALLVAAFGSPAAWAVSFTGLGGLPGSGGGSFGASISANGSVVTGISAGEAFRWTAQGGMIGLGDLPRGTFLFLSQAHDVSADGSVVVGQTVSGAARRPEAFRWTAENGVVRLGDFPGGVFNSLAYGISNDGSVVVGSSNGTSGTEAFRWTAQDGMIGLGILSGNDTFSRAFDASADGSVIIGQSGSASASQAFRWTVGDGMQGLGDLPGGIFGSQAQSISANGSVVVGTGHSATGSEAFVWDEINGMISVQTLLTNAGVDLTGWRLTRADGISADGTMIAGQGTNSDGLLEVWLADLSVSEAPSSVPEPITATLGLMGLRCTGQSHTTPGGVKKRVTLLHTP